MIILNKPPVLSRHFLVAVLSLLTLVLTQTAMEVTEDSTPPDPSTTVNTVH